MKSYLERVDELRRQKPFLRHGQALMMALQEFSPSIHKQITGTECDPSWRDDRISRLMAELSRIWPHWNRMDSDDEDEEITINIDLSWPFL